MRRHNNSAEIPSSSAPAESPEDDVTVGLLGVSGVAFVLFTIGVYVYGTYGGPFVHRLSGELGEVAAERGITAQKAGQTDKAIRAFQLALHQGFSKPRERYWTEVRLAEALLATDRNSEAAAAARAGLHYDSSDPKLHYLLTASLWQAKRLKEALAAAKAWRDLARRTQHPSESDALWYEGMIYAEMGQRDHALDTFLDGARLYPKSRNSYEAASILHALGRDKEALALLQTYLPTATGPHADAARKLRDTIVHSKASH